MLLPLLGACAVVGPFWGPEWEPVQGLLSQDCSCRDPRCCGNLLVICLFLVWQVRHFWYHVSRICSSKENVSKVPLQNCISPSERGAASFWPTPEFFSPSHFRDLDAHTRHAAHSPRWRHQRNLQEAWAQCPLSPQCPCRDSPWTVCSLSERIFGTSSLSSTGLLPQNSSWEAWHTLWCLSSSQLHPALHTWQKIQQLLVHSHELLVPLEQTVSRRTSSTSTTLAISLPDLPAAQRLRACPRESLPAPSSLHLEMLTWKACGSSQDTRTPCSDTQTVAREYSRKTQAPRCGNQREGREIQASEGQLPTDCGTEDAAEAKALGCGKQRQVIRETEGEILAPEQEKQMGVENRAQAEELGKKTQRAAGSKSPPETRAHTGENQEQLRWQTDAETQTPEWGSQDKNRDGDAGRTQTYDGKNQEAREGEEGVGQARGLEKQGHPGGDDGEEALSPEEEEQNQMRDDTGAEVEAEEGRNKDQVGSGETVQTQAPGGQNLEGKQQHDAQGQGQGQECGRQKAAEAQTPAGEKQGQGESERARNTEACRGENWKRSQRATPAGWENQGLGRGEDAGDPQTSRKKQFREIREVDWVVIKAPWWGNQRLVVSELHRELKTPCQGKQDQNQAGEENTADIQATEEREQREGGHEDGTNTCVPGAENKGQFGGESDAETQLAGGKNREWFGDGNGTDAQAPEKTNPGRIQGEDGAGLQEVGQESQRQLGNECHGNSYIPKRKSQEHLTGKDGANIQTPKAENWGELTSELGGESQAAARKKGERAENGEETQTPMTRNSRGAGGEAGTDTGTSGEGSQRQAGRGVDRNSPLSEWKNQEQRRSEDGTEIQAPEKSKQRVPGVEDALKPRGPERENGQLEGEIGGCCSPGRGSWEQAGGENTAESQAPQERNCNDDGSECDGRVQRVPSKKPRLLKGKVNGKSSFSEWGNQEQIGGKNGSEIQIRGERNLRGTDDDGTQAPVTGGQARPRRQTDGETPTRRSRDQTRGGTEDTAEIWGVGSPRKCRPEDATVSPAPRGRDEGQVRGKGAARGRFQGNSCGGGGPTGRKRSPAQPAPLTGFGCWALDQEETEAVNSGAPAPRSEMRPQPCWGGGFLMAGGEGQHVTRHSTDPASEHSVETSPASQQPQPGSQRRWQSDKRVDPAKASSLMRQPRSPQSPGALSACPPIRCGRVPHAARTLAGAPAVPPKRPAFSFRKSRLLLLESLMRRRIAHLQWGLPRRILQSYLLFSFLGPCSMPVAAERLPGLCIGRELQREQEKQHGAQELTPGLKSPKKPQRVLLSERKNSTLPTQARALQKHRPCRSAPRGISTPPPKPRRIRPPRGARELQLQQAVPTDVLPAPRNPSPAEPRSWCGPENVRESSRENSSGRTMIRPGVSEVAEWSSSRARTSPSRAGHNSWKEGTSWEASERPRLKSQQPTYWRGGPEPVQVGGPGQQSPSCSPDPSGFKGSLYSAAASLSETLLSKRSGCSQLARPPPLASNLSLRGPRQLPGEGDLRAREASVGVSAALEPSLQLPGLCWAGAALPRIGSRQGEGAPWNPEVAPPRFRFMKHLQCFFFRRSIKK
ncbi:PREDICTED: uncharacterized protein C22orf46 homolog [Chinchilla lanigera]|uniref:uncharacterized protein C22orf46 homolog n=1 Tax=Chinchilla lanigera TaxID=34839 RepID=UPI00038EE1D0|nr:PREDICTED: uncharacterized protein C22orf46 homolog [Chinchilla lanigera]